MLKIKNNIILKNKNFILLWLGQFVSLLGNNFHSIAAMWYVLEKTGSTLQMGTTLVFTQLPYIFFSPVAGVIADKWDRKKIIVFTDLINGILVGIVSLLIFTNNMELWMLYLISSLMSILKAFFSPAVTASIPCIVNEENLVSANSMSQFTLKISSIFGPILAGILISILGIPGLFLLDSISYIISSISESFMHIPTLQDNYKNSLKHLTIKNIKSDMKISLSFILKNKNLLHFIIVGGVIINFFSAPLSLYIPVFSKTILGMGSKAYGTLLSSLAAGGLISAFIVPIINKKIGYYNLVVLGLVLEGVFTILFGISNSFYFTLISLALLGASFTICNVSLSTIFQRLIPNNMMGRVSSTMGILCSSTVPLGYFIGGATMEKFSLPFIIIVSGGIITIAGFSTIKIVMKQHDKGNNPALSS